ncbi:restriction endonuclease [Pedobacter sp. Du54]|uniref:restriction endonuclease n=1 Tax=Pedobacter anseongensis TaxID=3133439 RepID=UPI0030B25BF6
MANANEIDWKEYGDITRFIYGNLGHKEGIKIIGFGKDCKVTGRSGLEHQVDVLTEQSINGARHLTAIECKFLKKKVDKDIVMKLQSIMADEDIQNGMIVCRSGFTKGTKTYAKHVGIRLVELREAGDEETKKGQVINFSILDLNLGITHTQTIISEIDLGFDKISDQQQIMGMHYERIHSLDGLEIKFSKCVRAFSDALEDEEAVDRVTTKTFAPNEKLIWNIRASSRKSVR